MQVHPGIVKKETFHVKLSKGLEIGSYTIKMIDKPSSQVGFLFTDPNKMITVNDRYGGKTVRPF